MFWNFMNLVHSLPTFERKDVDPWWNEEEQKALDFVNGQCYADQSGVVALVQELGLTIEDPDYWTCMNIGPNYINQNGQMVLGLNQKWSDFLTKHLSIGKYLGAATKDLEEVPFICHHCGEIGDFDDEEDVDGFAHDMNGFGRVLHGTVDEMGANKMECPHCGTSCELISYEEGDDINTVWVFEKASIVFCHYGRGAGLSFKYHTSLDMKGKEPLEYFKGLM